MCRFFFGRDGSGTGGGGNRKHDHSKGYIATFRDICGPMDVSGVLGTCEEKHAQKCLVSTCRAKTEAGPKEPQAVDTKISISKAVQKVMKPDEEKTEEAEGPDQLIAELEKQLSYAKKCDWKSMAETAEASLEELEKKK